MAFPSSPSNGQQASVNDITYVYNSTKGAWIRLSSAGIATANLTVAAVITDNYYRADGTSLLGVNKSVYNGTATAGTSVTLIDSVPAAGNTSVTWTITSNDNSNSTFKHSIVGSLNDGANVYYTEYGIILSNANVSVSTFTSNIVSGNLRLYAAGDSANVGITFQRTLLGSSTDVGYLTAGARGAQGPEGNVNISYGNTEVASYLPVYNGAIQSSNVQTNTANIQATTAATSTATGALRVMGGVGVGGSTYTKYLTVEGDDGVDSAEIKANLVLNTYGSAIKITPAYPRNAQLIVGSITQNTNPSITLGNPASTGGSPTSSTINFNTGLGGTPAYIQYTNSSQDWDFTHASLDGSINFRTYSSVDDGLKLTVGGTQGNVKIYSNAQSTSATTGALVVYGGLGVAKNSFFDGNLTVGGNLIVNGNVTYINANNVNINDSLIYLADDNPADTLDIGIVSAFTDATRYQHTGLVRDASDNVWKLFANVVAEPTTTVDFTNATYANLRIGNLIATDISGQAGQLTSLSVSGEINTSKTVTALNILNPFLLAGM